MDRNRRTLNSGNLRLTACGKTGPSRKKLGLAPFPQTQLADTTTIIDAEMAASPHFSSPGYFGHRLLTQV
jgi:hypothetical protein